MISENDYKTKKKKFINFLRKQGLTVNTTTKARGHQGICFKNRIDISKNIDDKRAIEVIVHEYAHFIHSEIEPETFSTGGTLEKLFDSDNITQIKKELVKITNFVDKNSTLEKFIQRKEELNNQISYYSDLIKKDYPNFLQTKKFKEFDKYIKKSKARYLLKHDRVKIVSFFLRKEEYFSIDTIERDFPDMPRAFVAYIKMNSIKKKRNNITSRINKLNKYYLRPTELFARFVEAIFKDKYTTESLAPNTCSQFYKLLETNYYNNLSEILEIE